MNHLLVHLVARSGRQSELGERLGEIARGWCNDIGAGRASGTVMLALDEDPFRMTGDGHPTRAFDASIEIGADAEQAFTGFEALVDGLAERLGNWIHADLSAVQTGVSHPLIACEPTPIRYQYCMRRRHELSTAQYLKHYAEVHSGFGRAIRGIRGYTQVHLDPRSTRCACALAGFGLWQWSSVSVLHLASLEEFLAAAAFNARTGFAEDEEKFIDRPNSVMWSSREVFRIGPEREQAQGSLT